MILATWNVNGIRARGAQVLEWITAERPDVVCLQEIKALPEQVPAPLRELEGYWARWHGMKAYSGVALLISKSFCPEEPVFIHPHFDLESRIVTALIGDTVVASVYVPNGGKDFPCKLRFLAALEQYAAGLASTGDSLLLCGDINIARAEIDVHPSERRAVIGQLPQEREQFERLLDTGLVDVGRKLDPTNESLFTWWAPWRECESATSVGASTTSSPPPAWRNAPPPASSVARPAPATTPPSWRLSAEGRKKRCNHEGHEEHE